MGNHSMTRTDFTLLAKWAAQAKISHDQVEELSIVLRKANPGFKSVRFIECYLQEEAIVP